MATTDERDIWKELRKPFDPKVIGKIPKGGQQLDYVGHAAVTDRLLTVDPVWTWEPVAYDERGLPQYDNAGGLWIRLTVGGVTRLGYGDGPDPKQRIGDALRNAAMRFGVALDLWTKDELESHLEPQSSVSASETAASRPTEPQAAPAVPQEAATLTTDQVAELLALAKKKGYLDKQAAVDFLNVQAMGDAQAIGDFTKIPAEQFDAFKKLVIGAGWKS